MYKRILVALDGSGRAERILPHALEIARCTGAAIVLLKVLTGRPAVLQHAFEGGGVGTPTPLEVADRVARTEADEAAGYFARVQEGLSAAGIAHQIVVAEGDTVEALAKVVREQQVDLVALITSAPSTLGRLFRGSTAESVLQHIDVPALMLRVEK